MTWIWNLLLLLVLAGAIVLVLKVLRPRLRSRRRAAWERAGLLPEQVDPHRRDPED